jgi:hypothetical protein
MLHFGDRRMHDNKWIYITIMVISIAVLIAVIYQEHEVNQCYLAAIQAGLDDVDDISKLCNR